MKKLALGIVAVVIAIGLVGCNPLGDIELETGDNGIYIEDDGAVSYGSCEKFDKSYDNEDQLEQQIDTEVADFNKSKYSSVDDACSVEQFKANSKEAKLVTIPGCSLKVSTSGLSRITTSVQSRAHSKSLILNRQ